MIDELNSTFNSWQDRLNHPLFKKTQLVIKKDLNGACYYRLSNEIVIPPHFLHIYHIDIVKSIIAHEIGHVILDHKEKDNFHLANKASKNSLIKHHLKIQGSMFLWGLFICYLSFLLFNNLENFKSKFIFFISIWIIPIFTLSSFYYLTKIPIIVKIIKPKNKKFTLAETIRHQPEFNCDLFAWWLIGDPMGLIAFLESVGSMDIIKEKTIMPLTHPSCKDRISNLTNVKNKNRLIKKLYKLNLI